MTKISTSGSFRVSYDLVRRWKKKFESGVKVKKKVKVSHSLIAVGAVGVRVPLYLGHS